MKVLLICSCKQFLSCFRSKFFRFLLWSPIAALAQGERANTFYPDIAQSYFDAILCSDNPQLSETQLWQSRYYFAQLNVRTFEAPRGRSYNQSAYKDALKQSDTSRTLFSGSCRNKQRNWLVVAPIPAGFVQSVSSEKLYLEPQAASSVCRNIRIDFAASQTVDTKLLQACTPWQCPKEISLETLKEPGYLSISCTQTIAKESTELWWLAPHRSPTMPTIKPRSLLSWINELRVQNKLSPLSEAPQPINEHNNKLAASGSLDHDLAKLQETQKSLNADWKLLGEDRVIAPSVALAATQLWRSAQHRALLVDSRATHLSISRKSTATGTLYVLLVLNKGTR